MKDNASNAFISFKLRETLILLIHYAPFYVLGTAALGGYRWGDATLKTGNIIVIGTKATVFFYSVTLDNSKVYKYTGILKFRREKILVLSKNLVINLKKMQIF